MAVLDKKQSINRSCLQCRERKIKCDRQQPCSQCTTKGSPDGCQMGMRKKRAQNKRPFPKRQSRANGKVASPPTLGQQQKEAIRGASGWADRSICSSHHSGTSSGRSESANGTTPSTSESLYSAPLAYSKKRRGSSEHGTSDDDESDDDEDSETESPYPDTLGSLKSANLLHLISEPEATCPFALKDVYADWRNMSIEQRRSFVKEIRETLPDSKTTLRFVDEVYMARVHSLHGAAVHVPMVRRVLTELLDDPRFEHRQSYSFGYIATALMVVVLALHFTPVNLSVQWENGTVLKPFHHKVLRVRQRQAHAIVKRLLNFETGYAFQSLAELAAAVLLLVYQRGSQAYLDAVADAAIRSAMRMRLHRLGDLDRLHTGGVEPSRGLSAEIGVRVWWYLVRRDWLYSHRQRNYRINPSQCNTRPPLNLFDEELLLSPMPQPHPKSTWTHVSYSLVLNDFSIITRTIVDQVNAQPLSDLPPGAAIGLNSVHGQRLDAVQRDAIDQMFQTLISSFPAHYSLETPYPAETQRIDVERWLLHQRLFHLLVQLHMPLVSEAGRPQGSLTYVANHILEIQGKVARVCPCLDNLRLDTLHALRACIVVLHDMFLTEQPSGLSRLMTRRKVSAALDKLPMEDSTDTIKLCVRLVRVLLLLEEHQHQNAIKAQAWTLQPTLSSGMVGSTVLSENLDESTLKTRYQKTTELLDIVLNEGYWRSFRKNLSNLEHLIPDWLQKSFEESAMFPATGTPTSPTAVMPDHLFGPVSTSSASASSGASAPLESPSAVLDIDPSLLPDVDLSHYGLVNSSAGLFPSLNSELVDQQDFEAWQNANVTLDFEKMLRDWQVELPVTAW